MIIDLLKNKKLYLVALVVLIALLPSLYFYNQYKKTQKILDTLPKSADETIQLLDKVGKLIKLPKDEDPLIATVSDKEKLKNQAFFQIAENGDKVLIYSKAKKAILYRPSSNMVVDVVPVNIKDNTATSSPAIVSTSPTAQPTLENKIKLAIYNGTKIKGLATTKGSLISESLNNFEVISESNSTKDYTENLIVNLKKVNNTFIQQLNKLIPAKITTLPAGEIVPSNADLLLIIGKQ
jgi:hypothetical protein